MGNHGPGFRLVSGLVFLLLAFCSVGVSPENAPESDSSIGNTKLLKVVKDEAQLLTKQFTDAFIQKTFRAKRSYSEYTYDVKLDQASNYLEVKVTSDNAYSFVCNGQAYILQSDGIYRLGGYSTATYLATENVTSPTLHKISSWSLSPGDRIIHAHEWKEKCFVLISNKNGTFSSIYTFHKEQMIPVFRQQIRNYGFAMAAKFFTYQWNLYLIIVNDNAVHSLTICPLFRWAGTYMDEIHSIQTRGAVAVETFTINSKEYIAIAQYQDAAENYEVGTQVLRMNAKEELEKVQLLWSYSPVSLKYIQILQYHFLVIGLTRESSICYYFGGIDFIYWQTLEGYKDQSLYMDSLTLPDLEPVLLAADRTSVKFYTRSSSSTNMTLKTNTNVLTVKPPAPISSARFLRPSPSQVYLTLVQNYSSYLTLKIYPVLLLRIEIAESQIKESESRLSQCLVEIRKRLEDEGGLVARLDAEKDKILTVDGDVTFYGNIVTTSNLTLGQEQTKIQVVNVNPDEYSELGENSSPASLQAGIYEIGSRLNNLVTSVLPDVLMKSKPGSISGDYTFDELGAKNIIGYDTNFEFETINGVNWATLDKYALRKDSSVPQSVTGNWIGDNLSVGSIRLQSKISDIEVNDFLLKKCRYDQNVQEVYGNQIFKKDVAFYKDLYISPNGKLNDIPFSDIVFKNGPLKEIRGYKHVTNLHSEGLKIEYINQVNFETWFESVMHTEGDKIQYSQGNKTFTSPAGNKFENFRAVNINDEPWIDFYSTVLVNGTNQTIEGYLKLGSLSVESLVAESINGVRFEDLMTISGDQVINSYLNISSFTAQKDLNTKLINGVPLSNLVVIKNQDAVINGPIELENFKISGSIDVAEYVTIGGKDVSELIKERQKHIYYTESKHPINFRAPVVAEALETEYINKLYWDDLKNKYWSKSTNNVVPGLLDLRGRKVTVENQFQTGTLNYLSLQSDVLRIDEPDSIRTNLNFMGNVIVYGEVYQADEKTLNGVDISEIAKGIVNVNEEKVIYGKKYFKANIVASGGLVTANANGVDLNSDVVFLSSPEEQYVTGLKTFKNNVHIKTLETVVDINVTGSVNGYNLEEVGSTTAYQDEPIKVYGNVQFNNSLYGSDLYVGKEINGVNLTNLLENIIYLELSQILNFPLIIQNSSVIVSNPSTVDSINGIYLKEYFSKIVYLTPPDSRINGTKTFVNLAIGGNIDCYSFNGISLEDLSSNAFSKSRPQTTTGKIFFENVYIEQDLEAEEIAGIQLSDLVYIDDPDSCSVNSNVRFTADRTVVKGPILVQNLLNGYPVEQISGGAQNSLKDRKYKEVEVKGQLYWEQSRDDLYGIGHLLENAVSLEYPQEITGKVEFADGFAADEVNSYPWINDVNLKEINEDGLHPGEYDVVFAGKNTFLKTVKVTSPPLDIYSLDVTRVDGINLRELDRAIIRDLYNGTIYGKKTFADGLDVEDLLFKDLMGKGNFSYLVTTSDNRTIDTATFYEISTEHLNIKNFENFNLQDLLATRVKIYGNQVLYGNYSIPGLDVTDNCTVYSINGIKRSDILIEIPGETLKIYGHKILANGLTVNGSMDLPNVNGYNFAALQSDVYKITEKQNISRPVIFVQPVVVNEKVEVQNHINDYRIDELESRFSNALQGIEERAYPSDKPEAQNLERLQQLRYSLMGRPFWLEYLRLKQSWDISPKIRVEQTPTNDGVIIGLYDKTPVYGVSLPKGCECHNVQFLKIGDSTNTASFQDRLECTSAFFVASSLGNVYSVVDRSVSFNQTCSTPETAETIISTGPVSSSQEGNYDILLSQSSNGFVSDVKAFSENGIDYLVVSHYFNSKTRSHATGTYVYSRKKGSNLSLVQTIPSYGSKRLALINFKNRWLLAIANTKDPQTDSCLTNSAIYRWSGSEGQFQLLREVRTNGATDVTFITAPDKSGNYEGASLSFVAFAQNGNSGDGEVVILLYDDIKKNYYMLESLRTKWSVTGVDFVCIQDNCFLLVVVPQEGVHFYEYRYVEGFQRSLTVPVVGAQDIGPLSWNYQIFFAIASSKKSLLAQGVVAGESPVRDELI